MALRVYVIGEYSVDSTARPIEYDAVQKWLQREELGNLVRCMLRLQNLEGSAALAHVARSTDQEQKDLVTLGQMLCAERFSRLADRAPRVGALCQRERLPLMDDFFRAFAYGWINPVTENSRRSLRLRQTVAGRAPQELYLTAPAGGEPNMLTAAEIYCAGEEVQWQEGGLPRAIDHAGLSDSLGQYEAKSANEAATKLGELLEGSNSILSRLKANAQDEELVHLGELAELLLQRRKAELE